MKRAGFYIIKDQFFEYASDPYLKGNKKKFMPTQPDVMRIYDLLCKMIE